MPKLRTLHVALLCQLVSTIGFADVPIEGMYLIRSERLVKLLKVKGGIAEAESSELKRISECTASVGHGYLKSFRFQSPSDDFEFEINDGGMPPPPGAIGRSFSIKYCKSWNSTKPISIKGLLVYTDGSLSENNATPVDIDGMPNTNVRVNQGWKTQSYAVLVIFVNAKR